MLPSLLMIGLGLFFFSRMSGMGGSGGPGNIFKIGKSTAKKANKVCLPMYVCTVYITLFDQFLEIFIHSMKVRYRNRSVTVCIYVCIYTYLCIETLSCCFYYLTNVFFLNCCHVCIGEGDHHIRWRGWLRRGEERNNGVRAIPERSQKVYWFRLPPTLFFIHVIRCYIISVVCNLNYSFTRQRIIYVCIYIYENLNFLFICFRC